MRGAQTVNKFKPEAEVQLLLLVFYKIRQVWAFPYYLFLLNSWCMYTHYERIILFSVHVNIAFKDSNQPRFKLD